MYDHVGIKVADLKKSTAFYTAVLAPLGHGRCSADASSAGFGPNGEPAFWLYDASRQKATTAHIAFRAKNRAAVDAFYEAAIAAGAKDNGRPGPRPDYGPTYYAAFVLDPDGNNIEAVIT